MIDSRDRLGSPTMDNYGDLLALAGMVRATAPCVACGVDAPPHRAEHLWLIHDGADQDATPEGLLCSRHALEAQAERG